MPNPLSVHGLDPATLFSCFLVQLEGAGPKGSSSDFNLKETLASVRVTDGECGSSSPASEAPALRRLIKYPIDKPKRFFSTHGGQILGSESPPARRHDPTSQNLPRLEGDGI